MNDQQTQWESLLAAESFSIRRSGRFLVVDLTEPHCVFSTSARNGGQVACLRHLQQGVDLVG